MNQQVHPLTPITPQSPLVGFEMHVDLYDRDSGFENGGTAGFTVSGERVSDDAVNGGASYMEYTATIAWHHVGRCLLGRKELIGMFGAEAVEEVEEHASAHYSEVYA